MSTQYQVTRVTLEINCTDKPVAILGQVLQAAGSKVRGVLMLSSCKIIAATGFYGALVVKHYANNYRMIEGWSQGKIIFTYNTEHDVLTVNTSLLNTTLVLEIDLYIPQLDAQPTPVERGQLWQHHKGDIYRILNLSNRNPKPGWEITVVYCKDYDPDNWYTRTLAEFLTKFKPYNGR